MTEVPQDRPVRGAMFVALGLLSMFGPISLDLYLPALPSLADELATEPSAAQLSITACLLGLAGGQLVAGPVSDRYGRRRPLIVGLVGYLLASAVCAFAPTIGVLLVLRLIQGVCGAAGLVIARAIARDLHSGQGLVIFLSRLMLISGLAPVLAPVVGGQLSRIMSWRGIFLVLAGFGVVLLVAGLFGVGETLPAHQRTTGGLGNVLRGFGELLRDPHFVGTALAGGLAGASMFAYIAGATFVLQRIYALSPQGFSLVFAINSLGIMAAGQVAARLAKRWSPARLMALGLALNLFGALCVLAVVLSGGGLVLLVSSLFCMVASIGMVFPSSAAITLADYPDKAGAAASLVGLLQYVCGGIAAPLVGLAGEGTAVPLGVVAASASLLGVLIFAGVIMLGRSGHPPPRT